MEISNCLYLGVRGHVVALDKHDGKLIWKTRLNRVFRLVNVGSDFVNVLVDGDRVYAHSYGEMFCLDAHTGAALWSNSLKGFGHEVAMLAVASPSTSPMAALADRGSGCGSV